MDNFLQRNNSIKKQQYKLNYQLFKINFLKRLVYKIQFFNKKEFIQMMKTYSKAIKKVLNQNTNLKEILILGP